MLMILEGSYLHLRWRILCCIFMSLCWIINFLSLTFIIIHRSSHRDSYRKDHGFFSPGATFLQFQEGSFLRRTDLNFPGGSICSSNRYESTFLEGTPRRTDISLIGLGGCFRFYLLDLQIHICQGHFCGILWQHLKAET